MKCLHPVTIKHPKGDKRAVWETAYIQVPCGHCAACLTNRSNEWTFRMSQEVARATTAFFVTLSYHDRCLPMLKGVPVVSKDDIRKFHYRLRKKHPGIRFFFMSEYSPEPLYRPHYHGLYLNLDVPCDALNVAARQLISKAWPYGIVDVRPVSIARLKYLANYSISKNDLPDFYKENAPPFMRVSQGFGQAFLSDKVKYHLKRNRLAYVANEQFKQPLPRYYTDKVFSDYEKQQMKKSKLDYTLSHYDGSDDRDPDSVKIYEQNYFDRHKKRSRYLTRSIE